MGFPWLSLSSPHALAIAGAIGAPNLGIGRVVRDLSGGPTRRLLFPGLITPTRPLESGEGGHGLARCHFFWGGKCASSLRWVRKTWEGKFARSREGAEPRRGQGMGSVIRSGVDGWWMAARPIERNFIPHSTTLARGWMPGNRLDGVVGYGFGRFRFWGESLGAFGGCVRRGAGVLREAAKARRGAGGKARAEKRRSGEDRVWT